ncbi:MAG: hypothetical protein ACRDPC_26505 [Solirubrobacteraceae bacterium]
MAARPAVRLALPLAALLAAAPAVSLIEGAPDRLPGVALGSEVLLHVERAAAIFAIVVAILSVLAQAAQGRLPTQLSTAGLAYEADVTATVERAVQDLQGQVDDLQASLDRLGALVLGDEEPQD